MPDVHIRIINLTKKFEDVDTVDHNSLEIKKES